MTIALSFDDGPNTEITPLVLDILEENQVPASFFLIANNITPESAEQVKRAVRLGCEINNHTVSHRPMADMAPEEMLAEIDGCTEQIVKITGKEPRFFRPPFISVSPAMHEHIRLPFICGRGCMDWVPTVTAQMRVDSLLDTVTDGDILLLHDMTGNINTVEALRFLVPEWKKRGTRFATVGGLFDEKGVVPKGNIVYSNVFQTEYRI